MKSQDSRDSDASVNDITRINACNIYWALKSFQGIHTTECRRHCTGAILGRGKEKYFRLSYSVFGLRPDWKKSMLPTIDKSSVTGGLHQNNGAASSVTPCAEISAHNEERHFGA